MPSPGVPPPTPASPGPGVEDAQRLPSAPAAPERLGFGRMVRTPGYRRLLGVRFSTQFADGMFQAALGGAVLFNPEREADPLAVAAGLAVLLLPYSVIGPFVGTLLDRWDRRRVLVVAHLVRAAAVTVVALAVGTGVGGPLLYVGALAVTGLTRFLLGGLSASLPHVVPRHHLVEANTLAVTAGAGTAALGGATAIALRGLVGPGDAGSSVTTLAAVLGSVLAVVLVLGFRRGALGPDGADARESTGLAVLHGLRDGLRAVWATPSVTASFAALAAHRLAFGMTTLLTLLLFRYSFTDDGVFRAGIAGVGEAIVLAAAGLGTAAVVAPWSVRRWGRARTVRVALVVAGATQLVLAALLSAPAVMVAAFLLGGTGQVVKLCTDAAVQGEAGDANLGRVFALYDIVFNVGYVASVTAAALLSPPDGDAPWLIAATAGLFALGLLGHDAALRRARRRAA